MIFKLKLLSLMIDPRWHMTSVNRNFFAGSTDTQTKPLPRVTIREIQHECNLYKFKRVSK